MKKYRAAIVLTLILIVPPLFFILLSLGDQKYRPLEIVSLKTFNGKDSVYKSVESFSLSSLTGEEFSTEDLLGKISVISVSSPSCGETCKKVDMAVKSLAKFAVEHEEVLFYTVVPDLTKDSLQTLQYRFKQLGAAEYNWTFLVGNKSQVNQFLHKELMYPLELSSEGKELVEPSRFIRILDKEGLLRGSLTYDMTDYGTLDKVIDHLRVLMKEYEQKGK